jgi:hypothetical protein
MLPAMDEWALYQSQMVEGPWGFYTVVYQQFSCQLTAPSTKMFQKGGKQHFNQCEERRGDFSLLFYSQSYYAAER